MNSTLLTTIGRNLVIEVKDKNALLGIVIPCYNEAENIPKLIERCNLAISRADCEFLLVDNGSTDSTAKVFDLIGPIQGIKFMKLEINQGYGGGILAGLNTLQNEFIGWTHADLQTDPVDIIDIELIPGSANQFLKGTRRKRRFLDQVFTSGMSFTMSFLFLTRLSDINAQPSVVSRDLFEKWSTAPSDFSLDLYAFVAARRESAHIRRFPVDFSNRYTGNSKWNNGFMARVKMTQRTIAYAWKLRRDLSK
jgi:glycosyltransferase involved in cell wall biosynthesis